MLCVLVRIASMRTQNIPFINIKKKITLNYSKSAATGFFFKGLKNEFESAVVNEPSVFEPLNFYCILLISYVSDLKFCTNYFFTKYNNMV